MKNLILVEWLKIKNYFTFRVMAGLFAAFLFLVNSGISKSGNKQTSAIFNTSYSFPMVWDNICYYSSYLILFVAILLIILVTNEFQFRTHRQNIIDGWGRLDFYNAKWLLVGMFTVATTALVFVAGLFFGFMNGGGFGEAFSHLDRVFYFFLLCLHYYGFTLLLALMLKRSGIAIGMLLLYFAVVKNILSGLLVYKVGIPNAVCLLPLKCCDELLPFPGAQMISAMTKSSGSGADTLLLVVSGVAWVAVYYFAGRKYMLGSDLKNQAG